jgi:hypothetical protein
VNEAIHQKEGIANKYMRWDFRVRLEVRMKYDSNDKNELNRVPKAGGAFVIIAEHPVLSLPE